MSSEPNICRICLDSVHSNMIKPCLCTNGYFHIDCFLKWIHFSQKTHCEVCLGEFNYIQVKTRYNYAAIFIFLLSSICIQSVCFFWLYYIREIYTYEGYETYGIMILVFILTIYLFCNVLIYYCIKQKYKFKITDVTFKYEKINPLLIEIPQVC